MSFTYNFDTNPAIAFVRLLIPDTVDNPTKNLPLFSDEEISAFYQIQAAQFQSSMFYSFQAGRNLPQQPLSYLRVAALALDTIANNSAMLVVVTKLLDVQLSTQAAALLAQRAQSYRDTDDNAGAFVVVEQCFTTWGTRDRFWDQIARQQGGGGGL